MKSILQQMGNQKYFALTKITIINYPIFEELDTITLDEVKSAMKSLKRWKSGSDD